MSEQARSVEEIKDLGWWVIHGDELMKALYRVSQGESPWLVYMEIYSNSEHEYVPGEDEEE